MNTLQKSNIGEQVFELNKMCSSLCMIQPRQNKADTDASMQSIVAGVRRLESSISMIVDRQRVTLLNVVPFDVRKVLQALGYIRWDITLMGGQDDAIKSIGNMISLVRELESLSQKIEGDATTQCDLYNKMVEDYRAKEWSHDYWSFVRQVKEDVEVDAQVGMTEFDALRRELKNLRQTHLNSYKPAPVKRLYDCVVNQARPLYEAIVLDREKLSEDALLDLFSFLFRYNTLKGHIDSIPLLKPVKGKYEKLFTCWAAKEYVNRLSPVLKFYGEFYRKEHYGVLLQVLFDLGLARQETTPHLPMMHYVNERLIEYDGLRFEQQTMITKTMGELKKVDFRLLELGEVGAMNLTAEKLEEYQDIYWRCFTILNQFGLRKPDEMKLASHLQNPHPNLNLGIVMERYSNSGLMRLSFLNSVLRRETLILTE